MDTNTNATNDQIDDNAGNRSFSPSLDDTNRSLSPSLINLKTDVEERSRLPSAENITENSTDNDTINSTINVGANLTIYNCTTENSFSHLENTCQSSDNSSCSTPDSVVLENHTPSILDNIKNMHVKNLFCAILDRLDEVETKNTALDEHNTLLLNKLSILEKKYSDVQKLKSRVDTFTTDLTEVNDYIFDMDCRIIENSQYSRRESIIISGIPDNIGQNSLETTVLHILSEIGLNLTSYEIAACHRLHKNPNSRYPAKTIVRFINRKAVDFCLVNRKKLIDKKDALKMNLRFYESLCPKNEKVASECRRLKRYGLIKNYYIRNGFIKIVTEDAEKPIKIHHPDYLYEKFSDFYGYENVRS